jgi:hypothetical protein
VAIAARVRTPSTLAESDDPASCYRLDWENRSKVAQVHSRVPFRSESRSEGMGSPLNTNSSRVSEGRPIRSEQAGPGGVQISRFFPRTRQGSTFAFSTKTASERSSGSNYRSSPTRFLTDASRVSGPAHATAFASTDRMSRIRVIASIQISSCSTPIRARMSARLNGIRPFPATSS